jgi:hypothetical protein
MKRLPFILAGAHAAAAIAIFASVWAAPERNGLAPIFLFLADLPFSLLIEWIRKALYYNQDIGSRFAIDAVTYGVLGTSWYFSVGVIIRYLARPTKNA